MRIFFAGGTGVLGRSIIPLLTAAGHEVTAITRSTAKMPLLQQLGATPVVVDALDRDAVLRALDEDRPEAVMNFLTDLSAGDSGSNALLRTVGARNLVDAAQRIAVSRMITESISWVYAPGTSNAMESDPLDLQAAEPRRTTIAGVAALESAALEITDSVVLRYGQLYGPGTWYCRDGRFGREAQAGRLPASETVVSFIHVSDAARAAVEALEWPRGIWNIVDDEPASGREWAPVFTAAVGGRPPVHSRTGDSGRPVSNLLAHDRGFTFQHSNWRDGFLEFQNEGKP